MESEEESLIYLCVFVCILEVVAISNHSQHFIDSNFEPLGSELCSAQVCNWLQLQNGRIELPNVPLKALQK